MITPTTHLPAHGSYSHQRSLFLAISKGGEEEGKRREKGVAPPPSESETILDGKLFVSVCVPTLQPWLLCSYSVTITLDSLEESDSHYLQKSQ